MKLRLLSDVVEKIELPFLKHVQSVDNHAIILMQLYHVEVGMMFYVKKVFASIG